MHIDKNYYPPADFNRLEPLEKRKLYLNQEAVRGVTEVTSEQVPGNVRIDASDTDVSSLATVVTGMQRDFGALAKASAGNVRAIHALAKAMANAGGHSDGLPADLFGSESADEVVTPQKLSGNSGNAALARQSGGLLRRN